MVPSYRHALRLIQTMGMVQLLGDSEVRLPGSAVHEFWSFGTTATRFLSDTSLPCDCGSCGAPSSAVKGYAPPADAMWLLKGFANLIGIDQHVQGARLEWLVNICCTAYRGYLDDQELDVHPEDRMTSDELDRAVCRERELVRSGVLWLRDLTPAQVSVDWEPGLDVVFMYGRSFDDLVYCVTRAARALEVRGLLTKEVRS